MEKLDDALVAVVEDDGCVNVDAPECELLSAASIQD